MRARGMWRNLKSVNEYSMGEQAVVLRGGECGTDAYQLDDISPPAWVGKVPEESVAVDVKGGDAIDVGCGGEDEPNAICEEGEDQEAIAGYIGARDERARMEEENEDVGGVPEGG